MYPRGRGRPVGVKLDFGESLRNRVRKRWILMPRRTRAECFEVLAMYGNRLLSQEDC